MEKAALIVVDVQRDFCEGGALACSDTLSLLAPLQKCIDEARRAGALVVFTQDWHPPTHSSFQANGGPWPVHCVANQPGAGLMPPLAAAPQDLVIHKGVSVDGAGYSGFDATDLARELRTHNVQRVFVSGIATEYCVRATALDAAHAGFETSVVADLIRPVDQGATQKVLEELESAGVMVVDSAQLQNELR
jgi:nicotinamidase/pyrazinamidase